MKFLTHAILLCSTFIFIGGAFATTITSKQAEKAVGNWLNLNKSLESNLGRTVESSRTLTTTNGLAFHVVRLNRGYVVTSGDTKLEPVIAYSAENNFDDSEGNPLCALLRRDIAVRARLAGIAAEEAAVASRRSALAAADAETTSAERQWAQLLAENGPARIRLQALASVPDVRVAPLLKSTWNQTSIGNKTVYNRYTPNNYVCGCVATAGAQVMRYFEWPKSSMAPYTCDYCAVDGEQRSFTTQAGTYDWSNMPLNPSFSITDAQCAAIGKLTSDIGICCGMSYQSGGSGAAGYMLVRAFKENFGYSNAIAMNQNNGCSEADTKNALISNLDAGLPCIVSVSGNGGHDVVGDGYGYSDGTLYYHFNMGWGGSEDVWYSPPNIGTRYNFNSLDGFVYNIYTNGMANAVICSGRVLTAGGAPIAGVTVTAKKNGAVVQTKTTNDKGIYAFILPAGSYSVVATKDGVSSTKAVSLSNCVSLNLCTGQNFGYYFTTPRPSVGNRCEQNIVMDGIASVEAPVFTPAGGLFYPSINVTLACATDGAVIRYTLDGSDPTETSAIFNGSIFVDDDITIKARAFKDGMNASVVAAETYVYDSAQGAPRGDYFDRPIAISGAAGERTIENICDYTLEDGEPYHTLENYRRSYEYQSAWFEWTAPGSGTMTFTTGCVGYYYYPTAVAVYEGDSIYEIERLAMSMDYQSSGNYTTSVSIAVEQGKTYRIVGVTLYSAETDTDAEFTFRWNGDLRAAAAQTPVMDNVPIPVKYEWLAAFYPSAAEADYANLVQTIGANGRTVWQSYLLGLDPTDSESVFQITTFEFRNGEPVIECNIGDTRLDELGFELKIKGKSSLQSDLWADALPSHRFFKVVVEPKR